MYEGSMPRIWIHSPCPPIGSRCGFDLFKSDGTSMSEETDLSQWCRWDSELAGGWIRTQTSTADELMQVVETRTSDQDKQGGWQHGMMKTGANGVKESWVMGTRPWVERQWKLVGKQWTRAGCATKRWESKQETEKDWEWSWYNQECMGMEVAWWQAVRWICYEHCPSKWGDTIWKNAYVPLNCKSSPSLGGPSSSSWIVWQKPLRPMSEKPGWLALFLSFATCDDLHGTSSMQSQTLYPNEWTSTYIS